MNKPNVVIVLFPISQYDRKDVVEAYENALFEDIQEVKDVFKKARVMELTDFMDLCNDEDELIGTNWIGYVRVKNVEARKPKFYKAELIEVKGNILEELYPGQSFTFADRLGNAEGSCPECKGNEWMLLPKRSAAVRQGGKPYIECLGCGHTTHL